MGRFKEASFVSRWREFKKTPKVRLNAEDEDDDDDGNDDDGNDDDGNGNDDVDIDIVVVIVLKNLKRDQGTSNSTSYAATLSYLRAGTDLNK